jgi:hypothetical protein
LAVAMVAAMARRARMRKVFMVDLCFTTTFLSLMYVL